ncbi:MAG: hypothetical protein AABY26_03575, partial [Nanoarchaeota archaeon]
MKLQIGLILGLLLFASFALAGEVVDQQQVSEGDAFKFAHYKCLNDACGSTTFWVWAEQTFVPTKEKLTKVELRLITQYDNFGGLYDPCDFDEETFDVDIKKDGDSIASKNSIPICGLPTDFNSAWTTIPLTADLTPGEEYTIRVQYKGNSLWYKSDPNYEMYNLKWLKSTSDSYSLGGSKTPGGTEAKDFTFKIWGYTPEQTCQEKITCDPTKTKVIKEYPNNDCKAAAQTIQQCGTNEKCEFSSCSYKYPKVEITAFNMFKDIQVSNSFLTGEKATFGLSTKNMAGGSGKYSGFLDIYKKSGGFVTQLLSQTHDIDVPLDTDYMDWKDYPVPSEAGEYVAKVNIQNQIGECFNNCNAEQAFTVNLPCVDNDGDGYGTGCPAGADCDDIKPEVHSTQS